MLKIKAKKGGDPAFDQQELFQLGLKHVRRLSRRIWTDYNVHDPGITTLELLCYALTELSHRASLPVADLIADPEKTEVGDQFLTATQILPNRPLTERDYRKLLIDLQGVRNAWIQRETSLLWGDRERGLLFACDLQQPATEQVELKGLYRVIVDFEAEDEGRRDQVRKEVMATLHDNRNLCEDFTGIVTVVKERFNVFCELELKSDADPARIEGELRFRVEEYLDPSIRSYTLSQMLEKRDRRGNLRRVEEIFEGPLLTWGFIDDEELEKAELRRQIRLSDLINIIMEIDGVQAVQDLTVAPAAGGMAICAEKRWTLEVGEGKKPSLGRLQLVMRKRGLQVPVREEAALKRHQELVDQGRALAETAEPVDLDLPHGYFSNVADYHSFQNHFPAIYGLSNYGLGDAAGEERKTQAMQLKGYLLFFDQVMADFFAQLARVKLLLSADPDQQRASFHQGVNSFRDYDRVYTLKRALAAAVAGISKQEEALDAIFPLIGEPGGGADGDLAEAAANWFVSVSADEGAFRRLLAASLDKGLNVRERELEKRNRFLDHLIARFAERFHEFAHIMYMDFGAGAAEMIRYKGKFLQNYPVIGSERGRAYNYGLSDEGSLWNSSNVSGLEKRLASLLGIENFTRRNLSDIAYAIYEEVDTTPDDEFRFRIRHRLSNRILLSSSTNYKSRQSAEDEMRRAILLARNESAYQVRRTRSGKYYFNIVDDRGEIIARRIEYFTGEEEIKAAMGEVREHLTSAFADEGMYVLENILLRPEGAADPLFPICPAEAGTSSFDMDPYSYRLHILLPAYGGRFGRMDFREYAEQVIRAETPAHILPKICWLDKEDMALVEGIYREWIEHRAGKGSADRSQLLTKLIYALYGVKNVYPRAKMEGRGSDPEENTFVLNRTRLGTKNDE